MEIIDLPHDLFLLIVAHLSARATVRCRRVSRRWRDALTDPAFCLQLMKWHFPRCREMRLAYGGGGGGGDGDGGGTHQVSTANGDVDWTTTWTTVASRYHHLRTATPRSVDKIRQVQVGGGGGGGGDVGSFFGVGTWDRYLRLDDKEAPFHYPDPSWCYSHDDGLLVYHVPPAHVPVQDQDQDQDQEVRAYYYPWRLLDLATRATVEVPFPHDDNERIVRRVRLHDRVLVFEWCQRRAYHQLNDREECHRHFVTALDLARRPCCPSSSSSTGWTWTLTERAEWKLHFLGFPLNQLDRFLSAHTATHYAVYVWQPNRSPWGEDDPIESVILWDIASSSSSPPRILRRMTWSTLAFYGVRQRATPKLRHLALDEHNLYFVEEEHRWAQGGHSSLSPPRGHLVRCTGIPIIPFPPMTVQVAREPSNDYHDDDDDDDDDDEEEEEEAIVQGPRWFDQCGADGDANLSFCARLNLPSTTSPDITTTTSPGIWNHHHYSIEESHRAVLAQEREAAARVATTRWPGWAPCWRHEEFPYLTVSEMVDFRAGVRITARHCFMLELLSVHVRPSLCLSVRSSLPPSPSASSSSSSSSSSSTSTSTQSKPRHAIKYTKETQQRKKQTNKDATKAREDGRGDVAEVQFEDDMWEELLDAGYICGEERWLIGQDRSKNITIVRF